MVTLADLRQQRQDLQGRVGRLKGIENRTEGQTSRLQTAQERLARNRQQAQNIRDTIQSPQSLRQVVSNIPIADPEGQGVVPLAYTLATQTDLNLPDFRVADLTEDQRRAFRQARKQFGAYDPYLQQGYGSTLQGIGAMGGALSGTQAVAGQIPGALKPGSRAAKRARQTLGQGIAGLQGTGRMYSPDMIAPFMSQYEDAAVQQALKDIARQGTIQGQNLAAQAAGAGAFGGSRQAIAQGELARNVLEEQGRTAAQMRAAGFENAAQRSQQAFEQSQARRQQASQLTGQLGQAAGNLGLQQAQLGLQGIQAGLGAQQQAAGIGQGIAALGQQQLGFGQALQRMGQQDINMLYQIGQQQQAQRQSQLDARRMTQQQQAMIPYQQLAFASDIITGAPTGITSIMSQPGPSPASQIGGLGLSAAAAYDSGMFGP